MRFLVTFTLVAALCPAAYANDGLLARKMWSAFACSQYAQSEEYPEQAAHLFNVGYEAGQQFFAAVEAGELTEDDIRSSVPMGVATAMSGPTVDFIVERIFANATSDAYERMSRRDGDGLALNPSDWIVDRDLLRMIAQNRYHESNCAL